MKQRSGSSSLSALNLKSFASLVKWCVAHYTRHMKCHVSLRVVCERTHRFRKITGSVNEPKSDHPGTSHGTHFPCIFQNGCVKEAQDSAINVFMNNNLFYSYFYRFKWKIFIYLFVIFIDVNSSISFLILPITVYVCVSVFFYLFFLFKFKILTRHFGSHPYTVIAHNFLLYSYFDSFRGDGKWCYRLSVNLIKD